MIFSSVQVLRKSAGESGAFFCADGADAVAVLTTFFAEEIGSGLLGGFGLEVGEGDVGREGESEEGEKRFTNLAG